ncbi:hypothetical protein ACN42_g1355 [Penicillium freii]|uniref:Uncharacterized protein n=1 Tax=Penicillium freii TaxID=48697 RepID=A0A101MS32_PENFR|nr:hypothetical protein ACN42_g1355 [Penicillium freii]
MQQTKGAKQAGKTELPEDGALKRFTSGTWVVLKLSGFSPTKDSFLAVVNGVGSALKALPEPDISGPKHVELAGKMVTIKDQEGKDRVVKAGPYYTGGPSRFVTNRTDAISSHEIAVKIAAVIPRTFFVLDEMRIGNTTGPKKRIVFADPILELFDLPAPGKEICIMWNRLLWLGAKLETMPKPDLQARWRKIYNSLSGHFEIPCLTEQGPPFYRPLHYLVAAFFEADKPEHETSAIISAIGDFMSGVRMSHQQRLFEDKEVRGRGREWLKSVGRRAIKSLSPRKRTRHSTSVSC